MVEDFLASTLLPNQFLERMDVVVDTGQVERSKIFIEGIIMKNLNNNLLTSSILIS